MSSLKSSDGNLHLVFFEDLIVKKCVSDHLSIHVILEVCLRYGLDSVSQIQTLFFMSTFSL